MTNEEIIEKYLNLELEKSNIIENTLKKDSLSTAGIITLLNLFIGNPTYAIVPSTVVLLALGIKWFETMEKYRCYVAEHHQLYTKIENEYFRCNARIAEALTIQPNHHPAYIAGMYTYLLENGFFDYNHNFIKQEVNNELDFYLPNNGLRIFNGVGACQNISEHFNEILKFLDLPSSPIAVNLSSEVISLTPNLEKTKSFELNDTQIKVLLSIIEKEQLSVRFLNSLFGNHVINAIEHEGKTCYLDITNHFCFKKRNSKNLEIYNANYIENYGYSQKNYTLPINYIANFHYGYNKDFKLEKILQNETISYDEVTTEFILGYNYVKEHIRDFEKLYLANRDNCDKLIHDISLYEQAHAEVKRRILRK